MSLERVLARVDRERVLDLLVRAVSQYSPPAGEGPAARVFEEALRRAGLPVRRLPVPGPANDESRADLVVHLGPEPAALHLVGHLDTIELAFDAELRPRRDGDLLYGLGTADMKSGCAAMVEAVRAVLDAGLKLERGVQLSLVVGEEEDGDGIEALIDEGLAEPPLTVVGEPTRLAPCLQHFGYLEVGLSGRGARAHAALPEVGANAIHATLSWVSEIFAGVDRLPYGERTSVSLREIRGGTRLFVVPDACEVIFDVHVPPGESVDGVEAVIAAGREAVLAREPGCELDAERLFWAQGYELDPAEARLRPLRRAFEQLGLPFEPTVFRSHSDANLLHAAGTATVVCGPGALEVAHTEEEHVSLDEVEQAARLYAALIHEACAVR